MRKLCSKTKKTIAAVVALSMALMLMPGLCTLAAEKGTAYELEGGATPGNASPGEAVTEETSTEAPTTEAPTTVAPTQAPTTAAPTQEPTTAVQTQAPEVVKPEIVVEPAKVVNTAVQEMTSVSTKDVAVVSSEAKTLTANVFSTMKDKSKNLTIGVVNDKNELQYSWTFASSTIKDTTKAVDLSISFDNKMQSKVEKVVGTADALYINFAYHGTLPGPATIKTYVGDKYADGETIYLYYFDEEQNKVLMVGNGALKVKDGYVEYTITHCSTYFVSEKKLNVEKDKASLNDPSKLVTQITDKDIPSGDRNLTWYYVMVLAATAVIIAGAVVVDIKKRKITE